MAEPDALRNQIEQVRELTDPIQRIKRVMDISQRIQQGGVELSRIRRQAFTEATDNGMSYADIAREIGLTRGRVSQIKGQGAAIERELFGIGPLTLGYPNRNIPERHQPVVATEDVEATKRLTSILEGLTFHVDSEAISPDHPWRPANPDLVAICGPKSSPTIEALLHSDPVLNFHSVDGQWCIDDRITGQRYTSPMDNDPSEPRDIGYFGKLRFDETRDLVLIAGVHAIGSVGVVDFLASNLKTVHSKVGRERFSMVIESTHDGLSITASSVQCDPILH